MDEQCLGNTHTCVLALAFQLDDLFAELFICGKSNYELTKISIYSLLLALSVLGNELRSNSIHVGGSLFGEGLSIDGNVSVLVLVCHATD